MIPRCENCVNARYNHEASRYECHRNVKVTESVVDNRVVYLIPPLDCFAERGEGNEEDPFFALKSFFGLVCGEMGRYYKPIPHHLRPQPKNPKPPVSNLGE